MCVVVARRNSPTSFCSIFASSVAGGARLRHVFNDSFAANIDRVSPVDAISDDVLRSALRNAAGASTALFVPQRAFEALARRCVGALRAVARQCVTDSAREMRTIAANTANAEKTLSRHQQLRRRLDEAMLDIIDERAKHAMALVDRLLDCELAYINTAHPNFIDGAQALASAQRPNNTAAARTSPQQTEHVASSTSASASAQSGAWYSRLFGSGGAESPSSHSSAVTPHISANEQARRNSVEARENQQIELLRNLLASYFEIARSNVRDLTPKVIMHELVVQTRDAAHDRLVSDLYRDDEFAFLLQESKETVERREQAKQQLIAVEKANKILGSTAVRDALRE